MLLGSKSPGECIRFDPSRPSIIHIVPRSGDAAPQTVEVDAHFQFHIANAYEDEDSQQLHLDIARADTLVMGAASASERPIWEWIDYAREAPYTRLVRYTFARTSPDAAPGAWTLQSKRALSSYCVEFPSVSPARSGARHRYIYAGMGCTREQGVVKVDVDSGAEDAWIGAAHEFMGESIFLPRKAGSAGSGAEDDGYLVSTLHDCKNKLSYLVLLDAAKVSAGPVCKLLLPVFVPFGLHGSYANGLVHKFDDVSRRFKAAKALDTKTWNDVNSGFSGLGISYDL